MENRLELINVNFKYNDTNCIFKDLKLCLKSDKINIILGESGVGKTTLLSLILGIKKSDSGEIIYNNKVINFLDFRRNTASYIDQDGTCFDNMTVYEHFKFVSDILDKKEDLRNINECLYRTGLSETILKKYPNNLSGGERKRFLISLSLYKESDVILLDEPTSSLDDDNCSNLMELLHFLVSEGKMIVIVTHDKRVLDYDAYKYEINNYNVDTIFELEDYIDDIIKDKINKKCFLKYINFKNKKQKILILLLVIIGTMLIGQIGETLVSNYRLSTMISKDLDNSLVKEIHLRKINFDTSLVDGFRSYDNPHYYNGRTLKMSENELRKIKQIDGIKSIYDYPVLYSDGYNTENGIKECINFINVNGITRQLDDSTTICVFPSYSDDHNIYMSKKLADMLRINDEDFFGDMQVEVALGIPIAQYNLTSETTYNKYDENTKSWLPYITSDLEYREVIVEEKDVLFNVSSIVDNNNDKDYFCGSEYYFIVNYNTLKQLINDYNGKSIENYKYLSEEIEPYSCEDYIVFVDSIENLENVESKISELDYLYDVNCRYLLARETLEIYYTNSIENIINSVVLTLISLFTFVVVLSYYLKLRKKEIVLLNNFGLSKNEIDLLFDIEIILIMLICLLFNAGALLWRLDNPAFILKYYLQGIQLFITVFGFEFLLAIAICAVCLICIHYLSRGVLNDRV